MKTVDQLIREAAHYYKVCSADFSKIQASELYGHDCGDFVRTVPVTALIDGVKMRGLLRVCIDGTEQNPVRVADYYCGNWEYLT